MKKTRNNSSFSGVLKKYRISYFIGYLVVYLILAIILITVVYTVYNKTYLDSSKDSVLEFIENVDTSGTDRPAIVSLWPSNQRMTAIYYMEDANDDNQMYYQIYGVSESSYPLEYDAFSEDATRLNLDNLDLFEKVKINGAYNLAYLTKVSEDSTLAINYDRIEYIRVYINIEGEVASKSNMFNIYILSALIIFALSMVAGYFISKQNLKPLNEFVQKQIDFVNDASHELRTPIAVVQSKVENILTYPDKTVCDVSESLAVTLNELNRLKKLTEELLTLARNDKNNIVINIETVQVNQELSQIIEPFKEIAMIQERELNYTGVDCYSKLDANRLKQIMIILIDNAIKYSLEGDKIDIDLSTNLTDIVIKVRDTGIGISEETKKRIFERFYREDKARSRETGGNGLGLSIAYTLVNLQKGKISVDHNYPKGTVFTITFPKTKI